MRRKKTFLAIPTLLFCAVFAGCRGNGGLGSQGQTSGNSSVVMTMTDIAPTTVTILSAKLTLTGATLSPGNVSLFSGAATVDLARLQTDIAYIATATNVAAGNYTSITLTFANPALTIENDTGSAIVSGTTTCAVGAICTIAPTTVSNLSATVSLTAFSVVSGGTAGLLIDVNLDKLLSAALGADFSAGTTVTPFIPAGAGAPPVGAEDVVGEVGTVTASSNTFTLTNAMGSFTLNVDSASAFFQFPSTACSTAGSSCLRSNQIVSVDVSVQADGSLLAKNIVFEDADSSDVEIEGTVTSPNAGSQQFNMVIQSMSAAVTGLSVGQLITVQYATSPQTPFGVDFVHVDNSAVSTSAFLFATPADLVVGQQVSIRRNSSSTSSLLKADRVLLRSSRFTATVAVGPPSITLVEPPSLFSGHAITQITAQTSAFPPTIYYEVGGSINAASIVSPLRISVRGPLFNVSGGRTVVTTKVVLRPQ